MKVNIVYKMTDKIEEIKYDIKYMRLKYKVMLLILIIIILIFGIINILSQKDKINNISIDKIDMIQEEMDKFIFEEIEKDEYKKEKYIEIKSDVPINPTLTSDDTYSMLEVKKEEMYMDIENADLKFKRAITLYGDYNIIGVYVNKIGKIKIIVGIFDKNEIHALNYNGNLLLKDTPKKGLKIEKSYDTARGIIKFLNEEKIDKEDVDKLKTYFIEDSLAILFNSDIDQIKGVINKDLYELSIYYSLYTEDIENIRNGIKYDRMFVGFNKTTKNNGESENLGEVILKFDYETEKIFDYDIL